MTPIVFPWERLGFSPSDMIAALIAAHNSVSTEDLKVFLPQIDFSEILFGLDSLLDKGLILVAGKGSFEWSSSEEADSKKSFFRDKVSQELLPDLINEIPSFPIEQGLEMLNDLERLWRPWLQQDHAIQLTALDRWARKQLLSGQNK